jgi:hypothetical protein
MRTKFYEIFMRWGGGKGNILHSLRQYGAGHMQEGET